MFKAVFNFLNSTVRTLGSVGAGIVMFFVYGLFGIFVLWMVRGFTFIFIDNDMITNEYIIEGYNFLFMTHFNTAQIVFASVFGLAGFLKVFNTD